MFWLIDIIGLSIFSSLEKMVRCLKVKLECLWKIFLGILFLLEMRINYNLRSGYVFIKLVNGVFLEMFVKVMFFCIMFFYLFLGKNLFWCSKEWLVYVIFYKGNI